MQLETPSRTTEPSAYQTAIYDFVAAGQGDGVVDAVPGSGKTTTLVQAAAHTPPGATARFLAFNRHIVAELKSRLPGMAISTLHGLGYATLRRAGYGQSAGSAYLQERKYRDLARAYIRQVQPAVSDPKAAEAALYKLVNLARLTLLARCDEDSLWTLAAAYDVDCEPRLWPRVWPGVMALLEQGHDLAPQAIDFTDQLWLPLVDNLTPPQSDWVFIDEAQDLSRAQLELALRARGEGGRVLFCGDRRQAIMAFAGADSRSMERIEERTRATRLPLSICYRCPRRHIARANAVWPGIEPAPWALDGAIYEIEEGEVPALVRPGALIQCRITAPLIPLCFDLIRRGIGARVRGRDIGQQLVSLLERLGQQPDFRCATFPRHIDAFIGEHLSMMAGADEATQLRLDGQIDRANTLQAIYDWCHPETVEGFATAIDDLFRDEGASVWLSTIHRAKGLEARQAFILRTDLLPHPRARSAAARTQEKNLEYVAYTRAKEDLYLVAGTDDVEGYR